MECIPLSRLRSGYPNQDICVRASRVWHFRDGLEDGEVKEIRMVLVDEQGVMSPVDSTLVLGFKVDTLVRPVLHPDDMFPEWTYRLTSFQNLPAANDTPRRFVDVIGVIRGISDVAAYNIPGRCVLTVRRVIILVDSSGHEIKVTLWGEAAFRFNGQVVRFLGKEESAVVIFVGTTVDIYEGTKELAGEAACKWYINVDIREINILRASLQSSHQPITQLPTPLQLHLRPQLNASSPARSLSLLLNQNFFQQQDGLFRCIVTIWRLTPAKQWWFACCARCQRMATPAASSSTLPNKYTCSNAGCSSKDASVQYCLHLLGSDGTGKAKFVLFGTIAQSIVGLSPRQTILNNYRSNVPITNLAAAAATIRHTPPELAAVVSARYKFLLYVTPGSFYGRWASFKVSHG